MRDPKRIGEILQLMGLLWVQPSYMDMRATQLLMNAACANGWEAEIVYCGCGNDKFARQDPWHLEDDFIIEGLKIMLRREGVPI